MGSGQPIVFLHNGGGTLWNWAHQLQHFASNYRIIAPDLPGFGRSHRPFEPLILDHYVEGLSELLETLDCHNPILVGNCIGSSIALEFAYASPKE
jgi:pimeloyl-ACP methyl ester carboxylesterase